MARHYCIIPGCKEEAPHALKMRLMRVDTSAVWAPNTGAYLCDRHATEGLAIEIGLRPKKDGRLTIETTGYQRGKEQSTSAVFNINQGPRRTVPA